MPIERNTVTKLNINEAWLLVDILEDIVKKNYSRAENFIKELGTDFENDGFLTQAKKIFNVAKKVGKLGRRQKV